MMDAAPDGSIRRLPSHRSDLLVFEILAKISESDIEWMAAQTDAEFAAEGEIDMLLIMRNYEGAEVGAIFDGKAISVQAKALQHVRRYAVVGAPAWARTMIETFAPVSPVEAKTFDLEEEAIAREWIDRPSVGEVGRAG